jgi:hypothetical protein
MPRIPIGSRGNDVNRREQTPAKPLAADGYVREVAFAAF